MTVAMFVLPSARPCDGCTKLEGHTSCTLPRERNIIWTATWSLLMLDEVSVPMLRQKKNSTCQIRDVLQIAWSL